LVAFFGGTTFSYNAPLQIAFGSFAMRCRDCDRSPPVAPIPKNTGEAATAAREGDATGHASGRVAAEAAIGEPACHVG
jgi:hypothetical protein